MMAGKEMTSPSEILYEPSPRWGHSVCEFNKKVYLVGGNNVSTSSVDIFDPATSTWKQEKTMGCAPSAIDCSACAIIDSQAFFFGGKDQRGSYHHNLWVLDLMSLKWSEIPQKGQVPFARSGAGLVGYNGNLILCGGVGGGNTFNDIHVYNLKDGTWSSQDVTGTKLPALEGFTFTQVGHLAVLFGGREWKEGKLTYMNDVYTLNMDEWHCTKETTTGTVQPSGRYMHAANAINVGATYLLVTGGWDGDTSTESWILNLNLMSWSEVKLSGDEAERRCHAITATSVTAKGVQIFTFGGYVGNDVVAATATLAVDLPNLPALSEISPQEQPAKPLQLISCSISKQSAESESVAEQVQKILNDEYKQECVICHGNYTNPKMLSCFHIYCTKCLQLQLEKQVNPDQHLKCPLCRQITFLPASGVLGLQPVSHIHHLFETLKKVEEREEIYCEKCKKREAIGFCRDCSKFVCEICIEIHQSWEEFSTHEVVSLEMLKSDATNLLSPAKKPLYCSEHPHKELNMYCETDEKLICQDCIAQTHQNHQVCESFPKYQDAITAHLHPVELQLNTVNEAIHDLDIRHSQITNQQATIKANICEEIQQLCQVLEARKTQLIDQLDQIVQQKLKTLTVHRDELELTQTRLSSYFDFVSESLETGSKRMILDIDKLIQHRVQEMGIEYKPDKHPPQEQADMKFTSSSKLIPACQQYGHVYCHSVCPKKCYIVSEGEKVAIEGVENILTIHVMDSTGNICIKPLPDTAIFCELVCCSDDKRLRCDVRHVSINKYEIIYQPTRKHELHVQIEGQHIRGSPFTVDVQRKLDTSTRTLDLTASKTIVSPYPGVCLAGDSKEVSVGANGIKQKWDDIGISIEIPPGAVSKEQQLPLSIQPCLCGPWELPDGYELASPVYIISPSFNFLKDVLLSITHWIHLTNSEDCNSMAFLSAPSEYNGEKDPVYKFQAKSTAEFFFKEKSNEGHLHLRHFCCICASVKKIRKEVDKEMQSGEANYSFYLLTNNEPSKPYDVAVFCASLSHPVFFKEITKRVSMQRSMELYKREYEHNLALSSDRVELQLHEKVKGPQLSDEWLFVFARHPPHIQRDAIELPMKWYNQKSCRCYNYPPTLRIDFTHVVANLHSVFLGVTGVKDFNGFSITLKQTTDTGSGLTQLLAATPHLQQHNPRQQLPSLSSKPQLYELQKFQKKEGGSIHLISHVAHRWRQFALALQLDGSTVATVSGENPHNTESACIQIFTLWLEGRGSKPVTWNTLIEALNTIELTEISQELQAQFA